MARKRTPGLYLRNGIWQIEKVILGRRICKSTGSGDLEEAEKYLARKSEEIRQASIYGVRPTRIFRQAAIKYLLDNQNKKYIGDDASRLKALDPYVGHLQIDKINNSAMQPFIDAQLAESKKSKTINHRLKVVNKILRLAADEWQDEFGLSWLLKAPTINLLPETDVADPQPLTWLEQTKLFNELPKHLQRMALFMVNTGTRPNKDVCRLQWEWEKKVPELDTTVFIIPAKYHKNKQERLVILNDIAKKVIEEVRGEHPVYVFTYEGQPIKRMLNSAWTKARKRASLKVRAHDLKHTFGRRLRAAGVSFEDRQDLLGHKSGRITSHYSSAEIGNLIEAANKVCKEAKNTPILAVLKKVKS